MDLSSAARSARPASRLAPGTRLGGGRYTIVQSVRIGLFAELLEATDATTGSGVSIHLLEPRLARGRELLDQLGRDVEQVSGLGHKNAAQVIELAIEGPNAYVATELVEGSSLRELLERKRQTGQVGFGSKGSLNIVSHVASALAAAEAHLCHGALSLDGVAVSRAGRIRVSDFGLSAAVPALAQLGVALPPSIAPEIAAGGRPTPASDVYGLGALLYEVLLGAPPIKGCTRPSEALPGVPAALDAVIGRSMSPNPARRFPGAEALREAVTAALAEAAQPGPRTTARPAAQSGPHRAAPGAGASLAESIAARTSGQISVAVPVTGQPAAPAPVREPLPMSPALTAAMADHSERWLISKGKLDYGPFTLAQLAEQVQTDIILPGHVIIDKDSGSRTKVEDHPLLGDLVDAARERRDEQRRAHAEVQHAVSEKRRGAALYVFIGLGVIALAGGAYLLVTKLSADKADKSGAIDSLEAGALQAKISFPTKAEQERRAKTRRGKRGGGPGGPAGGWDDTLNLDMSPDEDEDGGSERLDDSDVNPVIQKHGGGLARCLTSTSTRNATIEFIVKPTGRVSQVRVNGQTGTGAANCVRGVMQKMQFPTFNGVRSKHYFDMSY
jgi:hypothetical protein